MAWPPWLARRSTCSRIHSPPSFDGSAGLYAYALGSVFTLACLTGAVAVWMARELWRDRHFVHPKTALTAYRSIILLAGITGFMRATPEAIYMFAWNEVGPRTMAVILFFKRIADVMAFFPGVFWTVLLMLSYPYIANALKMSAANNAAVDLFAPWPKLVRPATALLLIFVLAVLVAVGKLYMGVPVR